MHPCLGVNRGRFSNLDALSAPFSVLNPGTSNDGQSQNRRTFAETPALVPLARLVWSFDFRDSNQNMPRANFASLQDSLAPGGANQLISLGLNNNQSGGNSGGNRYMARIFGYTPAVPDPDGGPNESGTLGANAFFKLNDFGVGSRSLGWHNLKVVISTDDGQSADYAFYVDDVLAERVSNVGTAATLRQYDNIVIGSGLANNNTGANFDNMHLEYLPPLAGDFNLDGMINDADYFVLRSHLHTDVSALTPTQAYLSGGFTRDLVIDGRDFAGFYRAFQVANGQAVLAALLARAPEPSARRLLVAGVAAVVVGARRRR